MRAAGAGKWRFFLGGTSYRWFGKAAKQMHDFTRTNPTPFIRMLWGVARRWLSSPASQEHLWPNCGLEFQFSVNCRNLHFQPCWRNFSTLNHNFVLCSYRYTARFPSRVGHKVTKGLTLIKSKFRNTIIYEGTWKPESKDAESSRPTCWCWEMSSSLLQAGISFHESAGEIPEAVRALVQGRSWSYSRRKTSDMGFPTTSGWCPAMVFQIGYQIWLPKCLNCFPRESNRR